MNTLPYPLSPLCIFQSTSPLCQPPLYHINASTPHSDLIFVRRPDNPSPHTFPA
ncbi:uncharacterized protein EI90DRAFT_3037755 [Cantharellus anzutake]|uniref:uncharacterized protein n=1 Tax=Cantharellus anzutake TaxID=1750568 RepID=UPI001902C22F|nr:uncharacterized protein EI90DRAFT_3037755 [Cantharellus anzutake]KAF8339788.1 hypothetical protein EI90DRAFT_3037755 [Cantharellus anzutake]